MRIPIELIATFLTLVFGGLGTGLGVVLRALYKNTEAINQINITLAKFDEKDIRDAEQEKYIKQKLAIHNERIDNHEKRIIKLEK